MKAMVLAAGLGRRLLPITLSTPKPLLEVGGKTLLEYQLDRICQCGITDVVINLHHLGEQIRNAVDRWSPPMNIVFSEEERALETGGGIRRALDLLGDDPFLVVSADVYMEGDISALLEPLPDNSVGRLLMTGNPAHHPEGDFSIAAGGVLSHDPPRLTYTGVSLLSPQLVSDEVDKVFPLRRVFDRAVDSGLMLGLEHRGFWWDVGTESRLEMLRQRFD